MNNLTDKETEIMDLLVQGYTSNEIATFTDLSKRTVDAHRRTINIKMNCRNVTELCKKVFKTKMLNIITSEMHKYPKTSKESNVISNLSRKLMSI